MKLKAYAAPHIRHSDTAMSIMLSPIIAMIFLYGMAYFYYGPRAVLLGIVSTVTAFLGGIVCTALTGRMPNLRDLSGIVTGMIIPLLMPASIGYGIVITASAFAILVAKAPFGGTGHNIFNPAAVGFSFAAICFSGKVFSYPTPGTWLAPFGNLEFGGLSAPAFTLHVGGIPKFDFLEILLGDFPGPMGATNILILLACILFLLFHKVIKWEFPLFFFGTVFAIGYMFPRAITADAITASFRLETTYFELTSGFLLFGGCFMFADPVTSPKRRLSRIIYAVISGIFVMLFRRFGAFEESLTFALILMNASVWRLDIIAEKFAHMKRHQISASTYLKAKKKEGAA